MEGKSSHPAGCVNLTVGTSRTKYFYKSMSFGRYSVVMSSDPTPHLVPGIGRRIAVYRAAAGLSQTALASRIGKSIPWLSDVERGVRSPDRLTDLINIATACKCTVPDLIGSPIDELTPGASPRADSVAAVREAILRTALPIPSASAAPLVSLDEVGERAAQAWTTWHTSPTAHTALARVLPNLIFDAHAAYLAEPDDHRRAARALSGTWQITRQWLHHLPDPELAWTASERALATAREADDPHLLALGAWAMSASYRRAGQQEEATRICLTAADDLRKRLDRGAGDDNLLADFGMLNLAAAISSAQADDEGRAWNLHRTAEDAARALGAHYDPWTMFGSGNVDIHGFAILAELGDADAIVDRAQHLRLDRVPSVERRARVLIDAARGYVRRREDADAVLTLLDAEKISADEVHHSTIVRELVREMLFRDNASARAHVRALAKRCGLLLD